MLDEGKAKTRLDIAKSRGLSPLVGRDKELSIILENWIQAKNGKGNLVLLNGEAGIGKSRLVDAIKKNLTSEESNTTFEARCSAYHQNSSFYPLIELLERSFFQFVQTENTASKVAKVEQTLQNLPIDLDTHVSLLLDLLSISSDKYAPLQLSPIAKKQRTIQSIAHLFLATTETQNVLFIIEDLHWADASTLEWLDFFLGQLPTQSLFLLCTTRPNYQPNWTSKAQTTLLNLQRLEPEQIKTICLHQTGGKALPDEVLSQIENKTEGVPLFIEELTKMVLEAGILKEKESDFQLFNELTPLAIPDTLQDSLLARLDRLSSVKGVVQLGAVIGREFSYTLLKAILSIDVQRLQQDIKQLINAEIIFSKGSGEAAIYVFKHALIQDAAYDSMLTVHKQQLHQKVALTLENQFSDHLDSQPELLAYHYTEAGLYDNAIPLWLKAGQMASQKHANTEAIAHLSKGISLLHFIKGNPDKKELELDYYLTIGSAYSMLFGYTDARVGEYLNHAREIAQNIEVSHKLGYSLFSLMPYYCLSENYSDLDSLIKHTLNLSQNKEYSYLFKLFGNMPLGISSFQQGKLFKANKLFDQIISEYNPNVHIPLELTPTGDIMVCADAWRTNCINIMGQFEQAKKISDLHFSLVDNYQNDSRTLYHIYAYSSWLTGEQRRWSESEKIALEYLQIVEQFGDPFFLNQCKIRLNIARAFNGARESLDEVLSLINFDLQIGFNLTIPMYSSQIGELLLKFNEYYSALSHIESSLQHVNNTTSHMHTAELYRLKGLALKALGKPEQEVQESLLKALEISRKQSAKLYELRAAKALAELYQEQGKPREGYELLNGVYSWFTEGFDFVDLQEAKALLKELN